MTTDTLKDRIIATIQQEPSTQWTTERLAQRLHRHRVLVQAACWDLVSEGTLDWNAHEQPGDNSA